MELALSAYMSHDHELSLAKELMQNSYQSIPAVLNQTSILPNVAEGYTTGTEVDYDGVRETSSLHESGTYERFSRILLSSQSYTHR